MTTAAIGDTTIKLKEAVDWVAGEEIIIAVTDYDHRNSELRTIASVADVDGKTEVTFDKPLKS